MKILFTLWLLTLFLFSVAQDNKYAFPPSAASWSEVTEFPAGSFPNWDTATITINYEYHGTSTIGGIEYSKMYSTNNHVFMPGNPSNIMHGYVHVEAEQVLFLKEGNDKSEILYDFSLKQGDTAKFFQWCCGTNFIMSVSRIDSVEVNSEFRRRIIFDTVKIQTASLAEVWIEGVGSIHGPLFPHNARLFSTAAPNSQHLSCLSIDGIMIWRNPRYKFCYVVTGANAVQTETFSIFPNPVSGILNIHLPPEISGKILADIFDLNGRLVHREPLHQGSGIHYIRLHQLKPGVYHISIGDDHQRFNRKLIVN